jgi:hypothetical protein
MSVLVMIFFNSACGARRSKTHAASPKYCDRIFLTE